MTFGRAAILSATLLLLALFGVRSAASAEPAGSDPVRSMPYEASSELNIRGSVKPSNGRLVWARDAAGKHQAARVYLEASNGPVLLMPNGRLVTRPATDVQPCNLAFRPLTEKAIADEILTGEYKDWTAKQSPHHTYIYNCSEEFTSMAAAILETLHAGVYDYFLQKKFDVHRSEFPLVVMIYKTEEQFRKLSGAPEGVAAFYSPASNHIVLYETPKEGTPAIKAAKQQILSTVAHEGVHQTLANIGVQQRLSNWPSFMTEGLAEYFAPTSRSESVTWAGVGKTNDFRWQQFQHIIGGGNGTGGQLVDTIVQSKDLSSDGYAASWALVHFLAHKRNDKFTKYLQAVSARKPLERYYAPSKQSDLQQFLEFFGSDLAAMETGTIEHIRKLDHRDPTVADTHFVVAMEYMSGRKYLRSAMITVDRNGLADIRKSMLEEISREEARTAGFQFLEFDTKAEAMRWGREYMNAPGVGRR